MSFVFVIVVAGILSAPLASALSWAYTPPWNNAQTHGPWAQARGDGFYHIYALDAAKSGAGHSRSDAAVRLGPPVFWGGEADVTMAVSYVDVLFIAPADGYYTVTWRWSLTGDASLNNIIAPFFVVDVGTKLSVRLSGDATDMTAGQALPTMQTTILSESLTIPTFIKQWTFSNSQYTVGTAGTPYPLFQGHAYYFLTHIETFEQSWAFGSGYGLVSATVNLTLSHFEIDISNPALGGGGGGGGCVLAGTMVSTSEHRSQPIETIRPGQTILGWDASRKSLVRETVRGNTQTHVDQVESINDGQLIVTVANQPLYVRDGDWEGWVRDPGRLSAGQYLFLPLTGTWIEITSIQALTGRFKVYDLVVTSPNDYIANGILVLDKV